ncbi:MAG: DDE-type integrase/transposase/recombinase [Nanoarchaeota archaeon]
MFYHLRRVVSKWKKKPRGWWTDEWQAYLKAFDMLDEDLPHGKIKHRDWKFKNSKGITTNAVENIWRQFRRWLHRKNGIKNQAYVDFYVDLFEAKYNVINNPRIMMDMLMWC